MIFTFVSATPLVLNFNLLVEWGRLLKMDEERRSKREIREINRREREQKGRKRE